MAKPTKDKLKELSKQLQKVGIETSPEIFSEKHEEQGYHLTRDWAEASGRSEVTMRKVLSEGVRKGTFEVISVKIALGGAIARAYRLK